MPRHQFRAPRGDLLEIEIVSRSLRDNVLGDPHQRRVAVYLPPGYETDGRHYPLLVYLAAFSGSGLKKTGWKMFGESLPQRLDRLVEQDLLEPLILALPDCFTSLGGNQYINNPILGNWEDFLATELVSELEDRFRILPGATGRAVVGFSSGGYGALIQALRHGNRWGAVACHSADMGFDNLFRGQFPVVVTRLAQFADGVEGFLKEFRDSPKVKGEDFQTLTLLAMAASYDPDPSAPFGIRLPVTLDTCRLNPRRWEAWLRHDPLQLVEHPESQASLRGLKALYFDCGSLDPYHLHYGARHLSQKLRRLGIDHRYEEFPDDHSGVGYRLDRSLPFLFNALKKSRPQRNDR